MDSFPYHIVKKVRDGLKNEKDPLMQRFVVELGSILCELCEHESEDEKVENGDVERCFTLLRALSNKEAYSHDLFQDILEGIGMDLMK